MGTFSIWHWLIVLLVVVLIFGTKKLKNIGSDLGGAVKGFKDGVKGGQDTAGDAAAPAAAQQVTQQAQAADANTVDVDNKPVLARTRHEARQRGVVGGSGLETLPRSLLHRPSTGQHHPVAGIVSSEDGALEAIAHRDHRGEILDGRRRVVAPVDDRQATILEHQLDFIGRDDGGNAADDLAGVRVGHGFLGLGPRPRAMAGRRRRGSRCWSTMVRCRLRHRDLNRLGLGLG